MLPKHSRLSRELFLATFKKSRRFPGVGFQLLYSPNSTFQASVVVAKKIVPRATGRNYLRRRIYGVLQVFAKDSGAHGRYIVLLSAESKKRTLEEVLRSLEGVLKQTLSDTRVSR